MTTDVTGTFSATGVSLANHATIEGVGTFAITGTFVGTWQIEEASTPAALSWRKIRGPISTALSGSFQAEAGQLFRVRCMTYTSGTIAYTISTPVATAATSSTTLVGASGRAALGIPLSAVVVTDADYGCIDDGQEGHFTVTYTASSPNLKCVTQDSASVTVANNGPVNSGGTAVATVTFAAGQTFDGRGPTPDWRNKTIAITCPDTTIFVSRVAGFTLDLTTSLQRLILADPAPANLATGSPITTRYACPCFSTPNDGNYYAGKSIVLYRAALASGLGNGVANTAPVGNIPFQTTIASVTDAYNIVLAGNITAISSASQQPAQMMVRFGTNNTGTSASGYTKAGLDAAKGRRDVWFPGMTQAQSTGVFYMFDTLPNTGATFTQAQQDPARAYTGVFKYTSGAEAIFMSTFPAGQVSAQDNELPGRGIDFNASMEHPKPYKGVFGAASLPRCAQKKSVINATVIGDSWAVITVFGQATNTPALELMRAFEAANPGKTVNWDWRGVGGTTFWDIISGVNTPGVAATVPFSSGTHPYLYYAQNHSQGGSPDVVFVHSGGVNDGSAQIHSNDVLGVYKSLRSNVTLYNGLPPDVVFVSYGNRAGQVNGAGNFEYGGWDDEYGATYVANIAKANSIPLIELGPTLAYTMMGWSRYHTRMRNMPNVPQAVVTKLVPYRVPYRGYNFLQVVKLVGTGGVDFWGRATTLEFVISAKDDNRIVIGIDASNKMTVRAQAWGKTVTTTLTLANGSAALTTSGQVNVNPNRFCIPSYPTFSMISTAANNWLNNQDNAVLWNAIGPIQTPPGTRRDYRTFVVGTNSGTNSYACDGNQSNTTCTSLWTGGHMFIPGDALANADVIITSGGTTLQTKCATGGYTDFQTMTLQDTWTGGGIVAAATSMFLGKITYGPGYQQAISAGNDATGNGYVVVQVIDNEAWVGYVPGASASSSNPMVNVAVGIQNVWYGKIERPGGMFEPRIYIGNPTPSSAVNIQVVQCSVGEPIRYRPTMRLEEGFPAMNPDTASPFGGDGAHPSQELVMKAFRQVLQAQDWNTATIDAAAETEVAVSSVTVNSTAATAAVIPADGVLSSILIENTTANAVTGGLDIGTTAGASDVASAVTVGANGLVVLEASDLSKKWFSTSAAQKLFLTAHTAWNSASLNVRYLLRR